MSSVKDSYSNWNCSETKQLKLPKIALKVPLLFLSAHCSDDDYDDDADNDYDDDDGKVEWPPEQRKKICINASGHPWYPIHVNSDHNYHPYTGASLRIKLLLKL